MKKLILSLALVSLVSTYSCKKEEAVSASEAVEVSEVEGTALPINTEESKSTWVGYKVFKSEASSHNGEAKISEGTVTVNEDKVVAISAVIDLAGSFESLDLNDDADQKAKLDGHLKSADFLEVETYPTAKFESTDVQSGIEGTNFNTTITGNLTLKDVTKSIVINANTTEEEGVITITSETFDINRKDWNVNFDHPAKDVALNDNVTLGFEVKASK